MANLDHGKQEKIFKFTSLALSAVFFLGIAILDGPEWCVDSPSYTSMDFVREPVYPLFLWVLRVAFQKLGITAPLYGLEAYLFGAVIIQSIVWVISTCMLGNFIYKLSYRALPGKRAMALGFIAVLSQIGVSCLNRFVALRGSMYSESIMTESLAMPLFIIFNIELINSFLKYDKNAFIRLALLGFLISSIRKQMLITLIIWGGCAFILYLFVKRYRSVKKFSLVFIAVVLAFVATLLFDRTYNLALRGVFAEHVGNSKGGLNTLLYTAEAEDRQLFSRMEDEYPGITDLYDRIYQTCVDQGLTIDTAPGYELGAASTVFNSDWVSMASHYAEAYDVIGFDVTLPMCDEYVAEHYPELDRTHAQIKENEIEAKLFGALLKNGFSKIFSGNDRGIRYVFFANILKAFVISNANISPRALVVISFVIYAVYLLLFVLLMIRTSRQKLSKGSVVQDYRHAVILMGFIVLVGIAVNSVVTGSMIFPQPRYMCYSMGLFYLTLTCAILSP